MNSLVLELQKESLDSSIPIGDLLRKALVVAKKLKLKDFEEWIKSERDGYWGKEKFPDYRMVRGEVKAWNPYHGWTPFIVKDEEISRTMSSRYIAQSIIELEQIALNKNSDEPLQVPLPTGAIATLKKIYRFDFVPTLLVNKSTTNAIVEAVRATILNWALKLEEDGILGEGLSFSKKEKETASNSNLSINYFINHMSQSQIQQGMDNLHQTQTFSNFDNEKVEKLIISLEKEIETLGLDKTHIYEMRAEISTIKAQLSSPKTKKKIIIESVQSISAILHNVASNVAANALIQQINSLFS